MVPNIWNNTRLLLRNYNKSNSDHVKKINGDVINNESRKYKIIYNKNAVVYYSDFNIKSVH